MIRMRFIVFLLLSFLLLGCDKDDENENGGNGNNNGNGNGNGNGTGTEEPVYSTSRTVLVYLAVDNNFASEAAQKTKLLQEGWKAEYDGNLLVYADNGKPVLMRIYQDTEGYNKVDTVATYTSENSASPEVLSRVMNEVAEKWPAESYGMVMLSHATGWLPEGTMPSPRSILNDRGKEMDIKDFATAIPYKLDFLIFDACMMGGIEVAYELKDVADYLVLSPAEVLVPGFVYASMMEHLMQKTPDVVAVAREFYDYFDNQKGLMRSATVSVVKSSALEELAVISAELLKDVDGEHAVNVSQLQSYGFNRKYLYTDFGHYIKTLSPERYDEFAEILERCIPYKANTPSYYSAATGKHDPIDFYSGLSIYIPQAVYPFMNAEYEKLKWTIRINE